MEIKDKRFKRDNPLSGLYLTIQYPNNPIKVCFCGKANALIFVVSLVLNQKNPIWQKDYLTLVPQTLKRLKSIPQPPKMFRNCKNEGSRRDTPPLFEKPNWSSSVRERMKKKAPCGGRTYYSQAQA
jgi:hypothetical protein